MKERIKKLRKSLKLTQQGFADRVKTSRNNIAGYEVGTRAPSEAVISLICREFHVNETWLRTGEGEMFCKPSNDVDQVKEWVQGIFEKGSNFEKNFVASMSRFSPEDWDMMEYLIRKIWEEQTTANPIAPQPKDPPAITKEDLEAYERVKAAMEQEAFDAETAALHAELNRQREAEKRAAPASSAGSSDTASLIGRKILAASPKAQTEVIQIIEEDAR